MHRVASNLAAGARGPAGVACGGGGGTVWGMIGRMLGGMVGRRVGGTVGRMAGGTVGGMVSSATRQAPQIDDNTDTPARGDIIIMNNGGLAGG